MSALKLQKSRKLVSKKNLHQLSSQSLPVLVSQIVPKHLDIKNKKRAFSLQKVQYKQPIADKIQRQKSIHLKPLTDVELILKKFDEVANSNKLSFETPRQNTKLQQRYQDDMQRRIKSLLSLPTIKNIKQKVQKQKSKSILLTEPQTATLAILNQANRLSILKKYEQFIKKAIKPSNKKLKTDIY